MNAFVTFLLVLVLGSICSIIAQETATNCDEELTQCGPDDPEVCLLHPKMLCFAKFANICVWKQIKCMFNLDYKIYDLEFCGLENFLCKHPDYEHQGEDGSLNY